MYNQGISKSGDVLDLAVAYDLIDKRGAYFRYNETLLGQGRENAKVYLEESPQLMEELEFLLRQQTSLPVHGFEPSSYDEDSEDVMMADD
jgi:recombination protein RecA